MITKEFLSYIFKHYQIDPLNIKDFISTKEITYNHNRFFKGQKEIIFLDHDDNYHHVKFLYDCGGFATLIRRNIHKNYIVLWQMMISDAKWVVFPDDLNKILSEIKDEHSGIQTYISKRFSI